MSTECVKRPGIVTFAAIMLFIVAGMHLVTAIELLSNAASLRDVSFGLFGQDYTVWGIIDLIVAALAIIAGIQILRGGSFGRWFGIIFAAISAIRSMWFFWWAPLAAFVVIAIDIAIIYGLTMHGEYYDQ